MSMRRILVWASTLVLLAMAAGDGRVLAANARR